MPFWSGIVFGALGSFVIICFRAPDPPCPRLSWKCWVVLIVGAIGATLYYWLMKFPDLITSIDFIAGGFSAFALSGFVHRFICPIK